MEGALRPCRLKTLCGSYSLPDPPLSPGWEELGDADSIWLNVDWLGSSGKGCWSWRKCPSSQPITAHSQISLPILLTLSVIFSRRTLLFSCMLYTKEYFIAHRWSSFNYCSPHFIRSPVRAPIPQCSVTQNASFTHSTSAQTDHSFWMSWVYRLKLYHAFIWLHSMFSNKPPPPAKKKKNVFSFKSQHCKILVLL